MDRIPARLILENPAAQIRVIAQPLLQVCQLLMTGLYLGICCAGIAISRGPFRRHLLIRQGLAEKEQGPVLLVRIILENTEFDFQGGNALVGQREVYALLPGRGLHALLGRDPAVAVPQQHDQKGAAAFDFVQTDFEDLEFPGFIGLQRAGFHAHPQINGFQMMPALPQFFFNPRKHGMPEYVALGMHVFEGA